MGTRPEQCCQSGRESGKPGHSACPRGSLRAAGGLSVCASASSAGSVEKRLRAPGFKASSPAVGSEAEVALPEALFSAWSQDETRALPMLFAGKMSFAHWDALILPAPQGYIDKGKFL